MPLTIAAEEKRVLLLAHIYVLSQTHVIFCFRCIEGLLLIVTQYPSKLHLGAALLCHCHAFQLHMAEECLIECITAKYCKHMHNFVLSSRFQSYMSPLPTKHRCYIVCKHLSHHGLCS